MPDRVAPTLWRLAATLCAALVALGAVLVSPAPAMADNTLSGGDVSPGSGTTTTVFFFSVVYASTPDRVPTIVAEVAGLTIPMALASGTAANGTYEGTRSLPAGTWSVTFRATAQGNDPTTGGGSVIVTAAPTPQPTPAPPTPTPPPPTPAPTGAPTPPPTPTPTPLPPGVTPAPTPVPTPLPPGVTPAPTPAPTPLPSGVTPAPTPSAGASATPGASDPTPASSSADASPAPTGSGSPDDGDRPASGFGRTGWLVLGGTTAVAGAAVLARQWMRRRH